MTDDRQPFDGLTFEEWCERYALNDLALNQAQQHIWDTIRAAIKDKNPVRLFIPKGRNRYIPLPRFEVPDDDT